MDEKTIEILEEIKRNITDDSCPADYIIKFKEQPENANFKKKDNLAFILEKNCMARLMLGRMRKNIYRNENKVVIQWPETGDCMAFMEIGETHRYLLLSMKMNGFKLKCQTPEISAIVLF